MSRQTEPRHNNERQPLHGGEELDTGIDTNSHHEGDHVSSSLIRHGRNAEGNGFTTYTVDPVFQNSIDNPYQDTTESDTNLRRFPSSDLVPKPWRSFFQVLVFAYISIACFIFTGLFAVKYTRRAHMRRSKGLWGMAQRDIKRAIMFIYISFLLGVFFWIALPLIIVCRDGC